MDRFDRVSDIQLARSPYKQTIDAAIVSVLLGYTAAILTFDDTNHNWEGTVPSSRWKIEGHCSRLFLF